ncbi:MAG: hypothetical protein KAX42_00375 [Sphaerotilus sp.]|nr:hypothetical protein [Sphaerotilus sp.]
MRNLTLAAMRQTLPFSVLHLLSTLWLAVLLAMPAAAQDWEQVAAELLQRPEFKALPLQIRTTRVQSLGGSPIEVELQTGLCMLHLRTRGHPATTQLLALAPRQDHTLWMQAILVHEIAHCWRWQEDAPALQKLAALTSHPQADPRTVRQAVRQHQREEAFADVAALAWVQRVAPEHFQSLLDTFQRLRSDLRLSVGAHDTRLALERVRRVGFPPGVPPFQAASMLLERVQAGSD